MTWVGAPVPEIAKHTEEAVRLGGCDECPALVAARREVRETELALRAISVELFLVGLMAWELRQIDLEDEDDALRLASVARLLHVERKTAKTSAGLRRALADAKKRVVQIRAGIAARLALKLARPAGDLGALAFVAGVTTDEFAEALRTKSGDSARWKEVAAAIVRGRGVTASAKNLDNWLREEVLLEELPVEFLHGLEVGGKYGGRPIEDQIAESPRGAK